MSLIDETTRAQLEQINNLAVQCLGAQSDLWALVGYLRNAVRNLPASEIGNRIRRLYDFELKHENLDATLSSLEEASRAFMQLGFAPENQNP